MRGMATALLGPMVFVGAPRRTTTFRTAGRGDKPILPSQIPKGRGRSAQHNALWIKQVVAERKTKNREARGVGKWSAPRTLLEIAEEGRMLATKSQQRGAEIEKRAHEEDVATLRHLRTIRDNHIWVIQTWHGLSRSLRELVEGGTPSTAGRIAWRERVEAVKQSLLENLGIRY